MNNIVEFLGMMAGTCTTLAFVPQVLHVWKKRSVQDISSGMYFIFSFGVIMWIIYGIYMGLVPLIISNIATLILAASILIMKFIWHKPKK